jgi:PTH1 family peptidyl-tRNA hydrolase
MKLIVGLGNPGKEYSRHRHNVGFMALERIAARHNLGPWKKRYRSLVAEGLIGGHRVMLLMPQTYMNESGQAVGEAQRWLKVAEDDIYVVHDEIDLAPGKIKVKAGGGNAGHNGLRSISAHIGNEYQRVRIGVGHPGAKEKVIGYVLHDFAKADQDWLEPMLDAIAESAGHLAAGDDARFLTDVTRRLQPARAPQPAKKEAAKKPEPVAAMADAAPAAPATAKPSARAPGKTAPAPARAAQAQRGGTLADSLKRWLRGK